MGYSRIQDGADPAARHRQAVDADRRPAKVERRDCEARMLCQRDSVHFIRVLPGQSRSSADELCDGRGGGEGEGAKAASLRDGAVADIGIGILGSESREVEPIDTRRRGGKPRLPGAADANAKIGAVARKSTRLNSSHVR